MITDIYEGKILDVWTDEEFWFFNFPFCTISIPKESMDDLFGDLAVLAEKIKEMDY